MMILYSLDVSRGRGREEGKFIYFKGDGVFDNMNNKEIVSGIFNL